MLKLHYESTNWSKVKKTKVSKNSNALSLGQKIYCTCLSWALVKFCDSHSFPFGIEGGMWDVIVVIPDHCLSIYVTQSR